MKADAVDVGGDEKLTFKFVWPNFFLGIRAISGTSTRLDANCY